MVTTIKILFLLSILSLPIAAFIGMTTQYLEGKSKNNKLRKWWSNNIVDLDDCYE